MLCAAGTAHGQTSTNFAIHGANLNIGGGSSTSAGFALTGCLAPDPVAAGTMSNAFYVLKTGCIQAADNCGNGQLDGDEQCDDGNRTDGDCCSADCASATIAGTSCGDGVDTDCTDPDTCDGAGHCVANDAASGAPAPIQCNDSQQCTADQCDGAGGCQNPNHVLNTPCGSSVDSDCTNPDTCDGAGTCLPNHAVAGTTAPTQCADSLECTFDECNGSDGCQNPLKTEGTACGDSADTACTDPDTCDAGGICQEHHASEGTSCGDASATDCSLADTCDAAGTCNSNHRPPGAVCDDANACTLVDLCGPTGDCDGEGIQDCDDGNPCTQDSCDPDAGCVNAETPRATTEEGGTCRVALSTALSMKAFNDGSGLIKWRWEKGQLSPVEAFGEPDVDTTYTLCVYDSEGGTYFLPPPRDSEPNDGKQVGSGPDWTDAGDSGWRYKNNRCDEEGIAGMTAVPGENEAARITIKAKGSCNAVPLPCCDADALVPCSDQYFHMGPSLVVQLVSDNTIEDPAGECWSTTFGDEDTVFKNLCKNFKSKRNVRVPLPD